MPTYTFYNNQTEEEFDAYMKISEREDYIKDNPHVTPIVTAPALVRGVSTTNKIPSGFNDVLQKVAEKHPTSPLAEKVSRKTAKQVKTEKIIRKHL